MWGSQQNFMYDAGFCGCWNHVSIFNFVADIVPQRVVITNDNYFPSNWRKILF